MLAPAFEQYVGGDERRRKELETRDGEILHWTLKGPAIFVQFCRFYVSGFFKCLDSSNVKREG
jgi:hypothetical protein